MRTMIRMARDAGSKVQLLTFPNSHESDFFPVEWVADLASDENIPLVRNDESFKVALRRKNGEDFFLPDDFNHPSELGYSVVAANVFNSIVENQLLN